MHGFLKKIMILCDRIFKNSLPEDMFITFRERRREEGERKKHRCERNIDWLPLVPIPTEDQTCNPSVCPDWESGLQSFGVQDNATSSQALGHG